MRFGKRFIFLTIYIFLTVSVYAEGNYNARHLTSSDIERVKAVKALLYGIDTQSLWQTINELEKSRYPQISLQIKEAEANVYTQLVRENNISGQKKKAWVYSMVCLNMAYLQFGGDQGNSGNTSDLNRLIRQKLKAYLTSGTLKQIGTIYSLE